MIPFTHLHVHSQYSILDGAASLRNLIAKAKNDGMTSLALTDHGDMFGIKEFHDLCNREGIKPLLGVETYVVNNRKDKDRSNYHLILIAKNEKGYRNLLKLVSIANIEGFYYRPRIDKATLEKYSEGLIVTTACIGGEVPQKIMAGKMDEAEETIRWFKGIFKDDYYLELQRHITDDPALRADVYENQVLVNKHLIELAKKYDIKLVATNDVHFINAEDADAHDLLICLNTGKDLNDENRMRYTKQEYLKTTAEMNKLFADVPEALQNTQEIAEKVEVYKLNADPIMPYFPIPEEFGTEAEYRTRFSEETLKEEFGPAFDRLGGYEKVIRVKLEADYLTHLTYIGAEKKYGDALPEKKERIDFELETIKTMGFPGYFLIVQDFINAAREMGVLVGPGRGSAAGAAVSYCVGITNIDPIKYDLLFERFLNPDRISMPDVDIDFDDDGRQLVLDWVTKKYGKDKVAHICTFGTMAAKLAIRDVARVLRLPLPEADRLAKMVPDTPKITLKKAFKEVPDLENEKDSDNPLVAQTLKFAETLEGSVRQTGVHACGILIGRDPLDEHVPLMPAKEAQLLTTQYDGRFVESIGLLKMDFLGLKTLSIIKETLDNIKRSKGIEIDIDHIPEDDEKTFELFSRGETTAIFQFESPGMKKHLRALKPNRFEDLVAMNALYRPGPMEYIPDYIDRKHGRKKVEYDHPMMEEYLDETYGITVFQEQVMLLSRHLGQFTRGESDSLRKAMGKKIKAMMDNLKVKFMDGCKSNPAFIEGCKQVDKKPDTLIEKIWKDWEAFASYAFNKSHSVCYARIAYQTGYLKAHYPAEFMAGVLSRNLNDITKITTFMEECRRMGLVVKGPDVNESIHKFAVNDKGEVLFGMVGIKGVGQNAVSDIVNEREANGQYKDIFDFAERVNLTSVNKKNWEALAKSGAFDNLNLQTRAQFFAQAPNDENTFIESMIKYGNIFQNDKSSQQNSLFGDMGSSSIQIKKPDIPDCDPWSKLHELNEEKDVIGIYLSAHPLDSYRFEIENFFNIQMPMLDNMDEMVGKEITTGGMVTKFRTGTTRNGKLFGILTVEDYHGPFDFAFFGEDYIKFKNFFQVGYIIMIKGRVQQRRWDNTKYDFSIKSINLLSEVREKLVKKMTLNMDLASVSKDNVNELYNLFDNNKGSVLLSFRIVNPEDNHVVSFHSRGVRINVTDDLLENLNEMEGISYIVN
ncbi:DNA polymerase III subunit alpha [Saccharicrinis sp. FJH54]|uniref:DNA polymerase III subunit alpha n=1 Tax=Saccharicrinis sp. FJH54 TaxID=3344665 RepID=UPI0035D52150